MATEKEILARYEQATRELAKVCKVRIRVRKSTNYHSGIRITLHYPHDLGPYSMATSNWIDAFEKVEWFARLRNTPLPPSAEALLKEAKSHE